MSDHVLLLTLIFTLVFLGLRPVFDELADVPDRIRFHNFRVAENEKWAEYRANNVRHLHYIAAQYRFRQKRDDELGPGEIAGVVKELVKSAYWAVW